MPKSLCLALGAAAVVFAAAVSLAPGTASAEPPRVATGTATTEPILHRVRLSGTVVAPRSADISTDLGGLVQEVVAPLGARVETGDVLLHLDPTLERLDLRRAEAATEEGRQELADARRRLRIARDLVADNAMPETELETRQATVRIARAKVDRLKAEEARFQERLRRHTITAPFAGLVSERFADAGEWVAPGSSLVHLVDMAELEVEVPVPQRHYDALNGDWEIALRLATLPDREVPATVVARVPVSDPTARTFTLRLRPAADDVPLIPGMSAEAILRLATGEKGVVVPRDAILRHPDGRTTVFVVQRDGDGVTAVERQVQLGRAFQGNIHIRQGLSAGARVVTRGNEALEPGQSIQLAQGET